MSKPTASGCKIVQDYLKMSIELDKSSVAFGDSVNMLIKFTNITSDTVDFYPKATYFLAQLPESYHTRRELLNCTMYLNMTAKVLPNEAYEQSQYIKIDSTFFVPGNNTFRLVYVALELTRDNAKYNKLCGGLGSSEVTLKVYGE